MIQIASEDEFIEASISEDSIPVRNRAETLLYKNKYIVNYYDTWTFYKCDTQSEVDALLGDQGQEIVTMLHRKQILESI
jgi:hypothetical protein